MIKIFGKPIIHRIVDHFYSYGFKEFYIALGYKGEIKFDSSMPDGTPRKLMSNEKIKKLGWIPSVDLRTGLELTVKDFINSVYDE